MIMSPRYMEFAREWAVTSKLDPAWLASILGETSTVDATDDDIVCLVKAAYPEGWRGLKRDADTERQVLVKTCYQAREFEDGREYVVTVHEYRPDGSCTCGHSKVRV